MLQDGMINSGFKDIGPVRSHSKITVDGSSDPAPWHGPKARYETLALSYNSAVAIAHASAAGKKVRLFTDAASSRSSCFSTEGHFETRASTFA
eukprot:3240959-Rhodomonas_salina.1